MRLLKFIVSCTQLNLSTLVKNTYRLITYIFVFCIVASQPVRSDFIDMTSSSGVNVFKESYGAVSCDWNKDGHIDIILNNHRDPLNLYRNNGDGTFTNETALVNNPVLTSDEHGFVCADFYPDDNYLEFAFTPGGTSANLNQLRKFFKFNEQTGKFEDIAAQVNFQIKENPGRSLLVADFNGDNRLDIFESAKRQFTPIGSAAYQFNEANNNFVKLSGVLNNACEGSVVLFSKYTDLDQDKTPEVACIGGTVTHGLFEFENGNFDEMWGQVSPGGSGGATRYSRVRDVAIADFNGDNTTDIFVLRRDYWEANAYLEAGEVRSRIATSNASHDFNFYGGNQVVTLDFTAPRLNLRTEIFYGSNKQTDTSLPNTSVKLQSLTLDPTDNRFWGEPTIGTRGIYIWYDQVTMRWHTKISSSSYLQLDTHHYASSDLSGLVLDFDPNRASRVPLMLDNSGANGYSNVATQSGFTKSLDGTAVETGDFDNDGDNDLYLVLSNAPKDNPDEYYENDGAGVFTLKQTLPALPVGTGENLSVADYNLDGCLDLVVVNGYGEKPNNHGPVQIMRGQCPSTNHWVQFDLDGAVPGGLGATVEVSTGSDTYTKIQDGGARRFGQNAQRLHFGLGENATTVNVSVTWADGSVTQYPNVAVDGAYTLAADGRVSPVGVTSTPTLAITNAMVPEGGTATLTVNLTPASTSVVTVDYQTQDGSATAGSDYITKTGTIVFQPGQTSKTKSVAIFQDVAAEKNETFTVQISSPRGANLGKSVGTATILDDESHRGFACGKPDIDTRLDREVFIWQACSGDGRWHVRANAGNQSVITYDGEISSKQNFSSVQAVSMEPTDSLDLSDSKLIDFTMRMSNTWQDGFSFNVAPGVTCFKLALPAAKKVIVGANRLPVTPPFNIETLGICD